MLAEADLVLTMLTYFWKKAFLYHLSCYFVGSGACSAGPPEWLWLEELFWDSSFQWGPSEQPAPPWDFCALNELMGKQLLWGNQGIVRIHGGGSELELVSHILPREFGTESSAEKGLHLEYISCIWDYVQERWRLGFNPVQEMRVIA